MEWLQPYTDAKIRELGGAGVRNLLAVPISFVSEHIETLEEIDMEYRELALESGIQVRAAAAAASLTFNALTYGKGGGKYTWCSSDVEQCGLLGLCEPGESKASEAALACWPLIFPPCVFTGMRQGVVAYLAILDFFHIDHAAQSGDAADVRLVRMQSCRNLPVQPCSLLTLDLAPLAELGAGARAEHAPDLHR